MRPGFLTSLLAAFILAGLGWFWVIPVCGCSTRTPGMFSAIKSDSKNLDAVQQFHFSEHGTYSRDLAALAFFNSYRVVVEILEADSAGWAARLSHPWFESGPYQGADCVVARGEGFTFPSTSMKRRSPSESQPIVCDLDGWRSGQSRVDRWRWEASN